MTTAVVAFVLTFAVSIVVGLAHSALSLRRQRIARVQAALAGMRAGGESPFVLPAADMAQKGLPKPLRRLRIALERQLEQAELALPLRRLFLLGLVAVLALTFALLMLVEMPRPLAMGLAVATVTCLVAVWISQRKQQQARAFLTALPDALDTLSRGLRAGRGLPDAFRFISKGAKGVMAREFAQAATEIGHGATAAQALDRMAGRMPLPELDFLAAAVAIQSETGGNLAETLDNLARAIREQYKLDAKARALSAEMRVSAVILAALPIGVSVMLWALNPEYMAPLVFDSRGHWMLAYAVLSVVSGIFIMKRMGRLDA